MTEAIKVLLADDDADIRLILRKLIMKVDGFTVCGEAEDGETALQLFTTQRPPLVFIDVEMPKLNGIECARRIAEIQPKTFFIFATAHEEYMPDAFGLYAADYILKPFKIERVIQTLERIKNLHHEPVQIAAPFHEMIRHEKGLAKLLLKSKDGISLVDMAEIILIQREERSTVVYTQTERLVTSESLSDIEERLDQAMFFRSHKSYIINLALIAKIYPYGRWTYLVKMKNTSQDALLTAERYEELEKLFG